MEYSGLIARLACREKEQFTLQNGDTVETLLGLILSRHGALARGKGALFIAVNNKALPSHTPAWSEHLLHEGDRVMLAVKIIGG